jgi:hypothetical protein
MSVAVYKLRIRDEAGDDERWQEARVVAASLAEALVQAQQRFGEDRVMAVAQDTVGEAPTEDDLAGTAHAVPEPLPDPQIVHGDADARVDGYIAAADGIPYEPMREPMPWEGHWRPANLLRGGIAAGLLAFVAWYQFGAPASQRFVTAAPQAAKTPDALALGEVAPRGGVLAATGTRLRPNDDDPAVIGEAVGEAVADVMDDDDNAPYAASAGDGDDETVHAIGALVGDMFARAPNEPPSPRDDFPLRDARTGEIVGAPAPALPSPPREPSVLQPYFVGVDRGGGVVETLRVPAYDADHARAIVSDLPERPVIVHGPSLQLEW